MKVLYIECKMGAAGDMLMAALSELIPEQEAFIEKMNGLGLPGINVAKSRSEKCGIYGTHMSVKVYGQEENEATHIHDHEHNHSHDNIHDHEYNHSHTHDHERNHSHSHAHDHERNHSHDHTHDHEHSHSYDHGHTHEYDHSHSHEHDHKHSVHSHMGYHDICHQIDHLSVSNWVKTQAKAVYRSIGEAEASVHQTELKHIHFHEVGSLDAVADVVGVCLLLEEIGADKIIVSPIHVGSGMVKCAHGILPVPAPATAKILKGIPIYGGTVNGELCTPTGAALLKHFADEFGDMPVMAIDQIGYGMGTKNFAQANCVRAFTGSLSQSAGPNDKIIELSCNLDDMTGEETGFAIEILLEQGALDVYTIPIQMKKSRPAVILSCLCKPGDADRIAGQMLKYTTSFGIRRTEHDRYMLDRSFETIETPYGIIPKKHGTGYGVEKSKYEYEDLARAAKAANSSIATILQTLGRL